MFKNGKEKEINYISAEEVEKMYEFQKKNFEAKFADQQKKIDELTDYISARFGEKVVDSDIGLRLNGFEESIKTIENTCKNSLKKNAKDLKKELEKETQKIAAELNDNQTELYFKLLQKNEEEMEKIQNIFDKKEENSEKISSLDNLVKTHIEESEESKKEIQEELKNTKQKISKINYAGVTGKFDKKIKEECLKLNEKIEEINNTNKEKQTNTEEHFTKELEQLRIHLQTNSDEMIKLQEMFVNENQKINASIVENVNKADKLDKKIQTSQDAVSNLELKILENVTVEFQNHDQINALNKKLSEKLENVSLAIKNNEIATTNTGKDLTNKIIQTRDAVNKLKDIVKSKNAKLEEKIKISADNLKDTETKYESQFNDIYTNFELETKKIKSEINEQIANGYNESKTQLKEISENIEDTRNSIEQKIELIGNDVLKLKKEVKQILENEDENEDVETLKKDFNKYIIKFNNELAKIRKSLLEANKKSQEQNRNLQVKIKTYIDSKITATDNMKKIEELINNLNLSIQEREKLQRIEIEELLNKKLKAIQKENERLLNKKIEEISSQFIRMNNSYEKTNPNNVTFYHEDPKNKKNVYELIDNKQILRKSAKSKNTLSDTQENKSQILKFFYDEDE